MIQFEDIYEVLPKPTLCWTNDDVISWLELNGLKSLITTFRTMKIDGKRFAQFTQQKIREQLKINSRLYLMRLVEWVQSRRLEYDQYVQMAAKQSEKTKTDLEMEETQHVKREPTRQSNKENNRLQTEYSAKLYSEDCLTMVKQYSKEPRQLKEATKTKLKPLLKVIVNSKQQHFFSENATIGRLLSNQIVISQDSISRFHAQISRKGSDFYIRDRSKFGTFLQNPRKIELSQKKYLIIGSSEVQVAKLSVSKVNFDLQLIYPDNKDCSSYILTNRVSITIGKKSKDFEGPLDAQLMNNHAKIVFDEGKVWLESMEGTTYRRLEQQECYKLDSGCCVKVGSVILKMELLQKCERCEKIYEGQKDSVCLSCLSKK